jgi:hypothetical protein
MITRAQKIEMALAVTDVIALTDARAEGFAAGAAETERKIVAWLRENPAIPEWSGSRYAALISDMIERGDYGRTTPPKEPANDEAK